MIGERAFPVAASRLWNTVPQNVTWTSAPSLTVHRKRPNTYLFGRFLLQPLQSLSTFRTL